MSEQIRIESRPIPLLRTKPTSSCVTYLPRCVYYSLEELIKGTLVVSAELLVERIVDA